MRVLFDQGTPAPLRAFLPGHEVVTAFEAGWALLSNGELIRMAETAFDALVRTDQNLRYQQRKASRRLAIVVLMTTSWPRIRRSAARVASVIDAISPGDFVQIEFPR